MERNQAPLWEEVRLRGILGECWALSILESLFPPVPGTRSPLRTLTRPLQPLGSCEQYCTFMVTHTLKSRGTLRFL